MAKPRYYKQSYLETTFTAQINFLAGMSLETMFPAQILFLTALCSILSESVFKLGMSFPAIHAHAITMLTGQTLLKQIMPTLDVITTFHTPILPCNS